MKFEDWVKKQNDEAFADKGEGFKEDTYEFMNYVHLGGKNNNCLLMVNPQDFPYRFSVYKERKNTIIQIVGMKKKKRGIAKCHENDNFNPAIGIAYAWARYKGEAIPTTFIIEKSLAEMKNGDMFYFNKDLCFFVGRCRQKYDFAYINTNTQILKHGYVDDSYKFSVIE